MNGRYLIFVPEINSTSFVFFYVMGERSYSVREYQRLPSPNLRYAKNFPYTASEIFGMARRPGNHLFKAERHKTEGTEGFQHWRERIAGLNATFLNASGSEVSRGSPCGSSYADTAPQSTLSNPERGRTLKAAETSKRDEIIFIKGYAGQEIRSFFDWDKHALPPDRRERQWQEGRSEFELAREWTANGQPTVPTRLSQLLNSHEGTRGTVISGGNTQHETILPFSDHGRRCHDLALRAERDGCLVTICIEAKADESFGGTVAEELRKARKRSEKTKFPERLDWLTRSLLGLPAFTDDERRVLSDVISGLQYQLFSAIAGTLLEAHTQNATMAIFVVHEFRTTATADSKLEANANALKSFLRLLNATNKVRDGNLQLCSGQMLGPISIIERPTAGPVRMPCHIPLFIGKIRTDRLG